MVSDASIQVLAERVSAVVDDIKEMKGKVDAMHVVATQLAGLEKDVISVDRKAEVALAKTDRIDQAMSDLRRDDLEPLKTEIHGNRKAWRWVLSLTTIMFGTVGAVYSQWHPWQDDINRANNMHDERFAKYSYDVGQELRKDDNRITVLEFRANNLDNKVSR